MTDDVFPPTPDRRLRRCLAARPPARRRLHAKTLRQASRHRGACAIEAGIDLAAGTFRCNRSRRLKSRNRGAIARPADVRSVRGREGMGVCRVGSGAMEHLFCRTCGLHPFGHGDIPAPGGEIRGVDVACLDGLTDEACAAIPFGCGDGRAPAAPSHL